MKIVTLMIYFPVLSHVRSVEARVSLLVYFVKGMDMWTLVNKIRVQLEAGWRRKMVVIQVLNVLFAMKMEKWDVKSAMEVDGLLCGKFNNMSNNGRVSYGKSIF
mmetsp:Transcript_8030/g.15127  ORF Transcript_8030/g.15127 Transcript_8030/m.15127 type:complete len:104 (-) Transcript_8030:36-347(-)